MSPFAVGEAVMPVTKDRVKMNLAFTMEYAVLQEYIGLAIVPRPNHPRIAVKWPFSIEAWPGMPRRSRCASLSRAFGE
ncbi:hypothetical protein FIBSPDRAFT_850078 [Athelia psychrophila]|uniref:Uncharacterized protein n=1 Tax=Athelia psychrophila TaxID=1759441 RepID=A0A166TXB3_9AGAM|nr:hypothetical protein FIBSPDRAFT_850078 [Fibularhizoctonia sp. CBS 109695]